MNSLSFSVDCGQKPELNKDLYASSLVRNIIIPWQFERHFSLSLLFIIYFNILYLIALMLEGDGAMYGLCQSLRCHRKEACSLTESLSTVRLQRLLAECLYLKWLPEKRSHLVGAAMAVKSQQQGSECFAASKKKRKKNKLHGLDCHGNWAGLKWREGTRRRERESVSLWNTWLVKHTNFKCQLLTKRICTQRSGL